MAKNLGGKQARKVFHQNKMRFEFLFQQQQIHVNFFFFPDNFQGKNAAFPAKNIY